MDKYHTDAEYHQHVNGLVLKRHRERWATEPDYRARRNQQVAAFVERNPGKKATYRYHWQANNPTSYQ